MTVTIHHFERKIELFLRDVMRGCLTIDELLSRQSNAVCDYPTPALFTLIVIYFGCKMQSPKSRLDKQVQWMDASQNRLSGSLTQVHYDVGRRWTSMACSWECVNRLNDFLISIVINLKGQYWVLRYSTKTFKHPGGEFQNDSVLGNI